jgi:hypothetical protein
VDRVPTRLALRIRGVRGSRDCTDDDVVCGGAEHGEGCSGAKMAHLLPRGETLRNG